MIHESRADTREMNRVKGWNWLCVNYVLFYIYVCIYIHIRLNCDRLKYRLCVASKYKNTILDGDQRAYGKPYPPLCNPFSIASSMIYLYDCTRTHTHTHDTYNVYIYIYICNSFNLFDARIVYPVRNMRNYPQIKGIDITSYHSPEEILNSVFIFVFFLFFF